MAYQNNIPQASDQINKSQADILNNFAAIQTLIDANHVGFANPTNQGKHNFVSLPLTSSSPAAPAFLATEEGIYNLVSPAAAGAKNEIYVHRQTVDSGSEVPMTASKMSATAKASCVNGWSYLPSGLLLKWGSAAAVAGSSISITPTVTSGGPNFSKVFQAFVTPQDTSVAVNFTCGQKTTPNDTSGNFDAYFNNPTATTSVLYLVIGV